MDERDSVLTPRSRERDDEVEIVQDISLRAPPVVASTTHENQNQLVNADEDQAEKADEDEAERADETGAANVEEKQPEPSDERRPFVSPQLSSSPPSSALVGSPADFSLDVASPQSELEAMGDEGSEAFEVVERVVTSQYVVRSTVEVTVNTVSSGDSDGGASSPAGDALASTKGGESSPSTNALDETTEYESESEGLTHQPLPHESPPLPHESPPRPASPASPARDETVASQAPSDDDVVATEPSGDAVPAETPSMAATSTTAQDGSDSPVRMDDDDRSNEDDDLTTAGASDKSEHDADQEQQAEAEHEQSSVPEHAEDNDVEGFRVLSRSTKAAKAECTTCDKQFQYHKGDMRRHAGICCSNPDTNHPNAGESAEAEPSTLPPSPPPAARKTAKRKYVPTEGDLENPPQPLASSPHEPSSTLATPTQRIDKACSSDLQLALSLQTPRRSKRIKRDPTQSPMATATSASVRAQPPSSPLAASAPAADRDAHAMDDDDDDNDNDTRAPSSAVAMKLRDDASSDPVHSPPAVSRCPSVNDIRAMNHVRRLTWLFGGDENAATMKSHYRDLAIAVHALAARFHPFVREAFGDLQPKTLVDMAPPDTAITVFVDASTHGRMDRRHTAAVTVASKREALELHDLGFSLALPAPTVVSQLLVTSLTHDLQVSGLVPASAHDATVVCSHAGAVMESQFYRDDCFVIALKGSARWKAKPGPVRFPVDDFRPRLAALTSLDQQLEEETRVKAQCQSAGKQRSSILFPSAADFRMSDDHDTSVEMYETTLASGSVLYAPGGTWVEAEVAEEATWLEIRVASLSPTELIGDALRQLCRSDEQWRRPILQSDDVKATRKVLGHLLKDLSSKIVSLRAFDLLPEEVVLLGSDHDASVATLTDVDAADADFTVDLGRHQFRGGRHVKIYKSTAFQESKLAFLMALEELPSTMRSRGSPPASAAGDSRSGVATVGAPVGGSASTKKALKKAKKSPVRTLSRAKTTTHTYVVHVNFGSADFRSKVRTQFRCSAFQAAIVEWIREQDGARFHASDVLQFVQQQPPALRFKKPHDEEEAAKYVLRFLCTIGFLSPVKMPPE